MAAKRSAQPQLSPARHLVREAEAITGGAVALFLFLSLISYVPEAPRDNLGGAVGHAIADVALRALGAAAYLFPVYLGCVTVALLRRSSDDLGGVRMAGAGLLVGSVAALGGLVAGGRPSVNGGGWLGGFLGTALRDLVGLPGAGLVLVVLIVVALVLATGMSAIEMGEKLWGLASTGGRSLGEALAGGLARLREYRAAAPQPALVEKPRARPARRGGPIPLTQVVEDDAPRRVIAPPPIIREPEPKPVKKEKAKRVQEQEELFAADTYRLPPLALLDLPQKGTAPIDETALHTSARILENKLADFGVAGKVVAVRPGPVITTFEFEPEPGVRVARIVNLADDLTMALRAASVRILAPIPGKPVVGVEVSNPKRETVFIREVMQAEPYASSESRLTLGLGKDTTGNVYAHDLARMPHLLIAGATGTGKSVSMNAMILSILYKASPRDCRMIMIDPKMLELSVYEHIPHLLVPVVTNPKKSAAALNNMVREMEDRYRLLHDKGVRNLDSYNRLIAQEQEAAAARAAEAEAEDEEEEVDDEDPELEGADDEEEEDDEEEAAAPQASGRGEGTLNHRHLPRIVVIIDELGDLMLTVGHEIEESITRLAQKARAAGIHLILATQRPSVDVITGLIKANFPSRISFKVTSGTNSRTILDCVGAERLLGEGDMLFIPPGTARMVRLHGAFVSDEEVHKVVDYIKRQEQPRYEMELLEGEEEEEEGGAPEEDFDDALYDQAVHQVTEHRQASISWLQRRLRIGYNRAARMIERMEREGVVSAPLGPKGREVIARRIED
ncbi:MAG: DNA translocase FtsK 4TM domain-containing protein [bacterium]|nr:DNA translocase FtsK 4TM domain-containing protein [bacterium]